MYFVGASGARRWTEEAAQVCSQRWRGVTRPTNHTQWGQVFYQRSWKIIYVLKTFKNCEYFVFSSRDFDHDTAFALPCSLMTSSSSCSEVSVPGGVLLENETLSPLEQLRQRWENLNNDQNTKLQLSLNSLEQDQLSPVYMPETVHFYFMH